MDSFVGGHTAGKRYGAIGPRIVLELRSKTDNEICGENGYKFENLQNTTDRAYDLVRMGRKNPTEDAKV